MKQRHSLHTVMMATVAAVVVCAAPALAQLRVVTWNVTNYSSGRVDAFQTSFYGEFEGRSMSPDVVVGQEFLSQTGVNNFLSLLNTAPGGPGDWAAAPYINGNDTDNAFFYRTSKIVFLGVTTVSQGGLAPNHPRDVQRYDVRLAGYGSEGAVLACYSSHMKAGTGGDDQARRLVEAEAIRGDAELLSAEWNFLLGGDFNIQSSTQDAYRELVGSQVNNDGRFFDPIKTPGSWNNTSFFKFVHTQDPTGAGGMDDRHDQLLVSYSLVDGEGFDYLGDPSIAYSTSMWDDANHSYRSWGNDGTSYNVSLTVTGNTMVGATIAQALKTSASGGGHLPVFLDLVVPPHVDSDEVLDFGQVEQDAVAELALDVWNAGDTAIWTQAGIADLDYSLEATTGFTAPAGGFSELAGGGVDSHIIEMDTSTLGTIAGVLTIYSNAPDEPERVVVLTGEVVSAEPCPGDLDDDGFVGLSDLSILLSNFGMPSGATWADGDLDDDGDVDLSDLSELLAVYNTTCP